MRFSSRIGNSSGVLGHHTEEGSVTKVQALEIDLAMSSNFTASIGRVAAFFRVGCVATL